MKFDFFTFGGSIFWEDVFFYQKWRIQRNCITKTYRLLDSWDIRRESGSFEKCQKAFVKYIDCYEITKQQGKLIILLHGYGDSKNIFKPLWRKFILTNATTAALNYPSLFRASLETAHQVLFFLNHIEDIDEVSFVTKGAGSLVLRQMFNLPMELLNFKNNMRIRSIVEINPVIKESLWCDFLCKFRVFRFLLGPMAQEMQERSLKYMPDLPPEYNVLKIFSQSKTYRLLLKVLKIIHFPVNEFKYKKKGAIFVEGTTFKTLNNEQVLNYTVKFINNGKI